MLEYKKPSGNVTVNTACPIIPQILDGFNERERDYKKVRGTTGRIERECGKNKRKLRGRKFFPMSHYFIPFQGLIPSLGKESTMSMGHINISESREHCKAASQEPGAP